MGSWLQEGIAEQSISYTVGEQQFDVRAWRFLVRGFIEYVADLDLTEPNSYEDEGLRALHRIWSHGQDMARAASFLKKIRPPSDYLYVSSIVEDDIEEQVCDKMRDAIFEEKCRKYEEAWLSQPGVKKD
jgi:hypothetical protein